MKNDYKNPNENWYYHQREQKSKYSYKACFFCFVGIIVFVVLSMLLSGCKSIQYVPVETVRTEYVTKTDTFLQKDSVRLHDSVYIHSKGDTVWYEKWHTKYRDKIVTKIVIDSFIKTDSIQVPYPVEKKLTKWQKLKMDMGGIALSVCLFAVVIFIVSWLVRRKGK